MCFFDSGSVPVPVKWAPEFTGISLFDVIMVDSRFLQAIILLLYKVSFCVVLVPTNFTNLGDIVEPLKFVGIVDTYVAEFVN